MLFQRMVSSGHFLFRWRSFLLLAFVPLFVWAVMQGESIETGWGKVQGEIAEILAVLLVIGGEAIRIGTVGFVPRGTSGRNTAQGQIAERLNTSGFYSVVRNPLYLGNCLMYLGLALYTQHLWVVAILALTLALYYERIIAAEESFLSEKFGAPYAAWTQETPAFFPRLRGWTRPDMPFSLRTVIRREHASIVGAFIALYLLELGLHTGPAATDAIEPWWHVAAALAVIAELLVIVLKRSTGLLEVEGR
ncbi:MAG: hypothetical protein KJZ59_10575 [Pararhodobacter sp.]|nr:hypothetical protein [Pararhodobacter sp.]